MTQRELVKTLALLGMTRMGFAVIIGVNYTTVRDWCAGRSRIPGAVVVLLHLMLDTKTGVKDLRS
jgi:DNA-binding transcriptional regulator YiaG